MILSVEPTTKQDTKDILPLSGDEVMHCIVENYPSWAGKVDGKIYFIAGVMEVEGPLVWFFMDKKIRKNPKSFLKLILSGMSELCKIYSYYDILVCRYDERALKFAYRLGFKNYKIIGDFVRLRWQTQLQ